MAKSKEPKEEPSMDDMMRRMFAESSLPGPDERPVGFSSGVPHDIPPGLGEILRSLAREVAAMKLRDIAQRLGPADAHGGEYDNMPLEIRAAAATAHIGVLLPTAVESGDPAHYRYIIDQVVRLILGDPKVYQEYIEVYNQENQGLTPIPYDAGEKVESYYDKDR